MKNGEKVFQLDVLNKILDDLIENTIIEMDACVLADELSDHKIRRITAERSTIKRIRAILNMQMEENNE